MAAYINEGCPYISIIGYHHYGAAIRLSLVYQHQKQQQEQCLYCQTPANAASRTSASFITIIIILAAATVMLLLFMMPSSVAVNVKTCQSAELQVTNNVIA